MSYRFLRRAVARRVLACAASTACLAAPLAHAADSFAVTPAQIQALGVQTERLAASPDGTAAGARYTAQVTLPPQQDRVLSAPVDGAIERLLVSENDRVRPGQPVVRLVSREVGELQLQLVEANSRNQLATQTLQREQQLLAEGIVPARRVQEAEAAAEQARARQQQARSALRLIGFGDAAIERMARGTRVDNTLTLRAASGGVVVGLAVKPGQRVQHADALLHIADTSTLWLDVQLPLTRQADAALLKGTPVQVVGRDVRASVLGLGTTVSDSQTLTLRSRVTRGAAQLRVGEVLQVELPFPSSEAGWTVPLAALARDGAQAYVFVRTAQGFTATPVQVLASSGQTARVAGPLRADMAIATRSVVALKAAWQGKGGSN